MVAVANPGGNIQVNNGATPCEGTRAFPVNLDFTAANAYQVDLTQQYNQKQFTTLQTVWIDNSANTSEFELICAGTQQTIVAPPQSQGFYAMLQPVPPQFVAQTNGSLKMQIILLNFYIPPQVWEMSAVSAGGLPQVDVPALDAVISGGAVQVSASPITITGLVNGSGTIAVGGTAQSILAANAARKRFTLANPDTATETLYFMFGNAANGQIPLKPGAVWDESGSTVVGDQIFAIAASTGHAFTLYSK